MQVTLQQDASSDSKLLVIDGVVFNDSWGSRSESGKISGSIYDEKPSYRFLLNCPLGELIQQFEFLSLPFEPEWCDDIVALEAVTSRWRAAQPSMRLTFRFESEDWALPWSISQYCREVIEAAGDWASEGLECDADDEFFVNDFAFKWPIANINGSIQDELDRWNPRLAALMEQVRARLRIKAGANTLVNVFAFPPEVETACQQYLVYFGQFLADLGIQAEVGVAREAQKILFSVTPADPKEALQTLRDALHAYLQLPGDAGLRQQLAGSSDIAAFQLNANVLHLQSQVQLAAAVLEAKNQTIEALRLENYLLKQTPPPALPPAPAPSPKPDAEPLVPNLVTVKDIEIKGFVIHAPEFIRGLKRRFGRNKN